MTLKSQLAQAFDAREPEPSEDIPAGFQRPFRFDGICFVWDANGQMAADFNGDNDSLRARGWGRIQYLPKLRGGSEAHALMDAWEAWVDRVTEGAASPEDVVERMNRPPEEA